MKSPLEWRVTPLRETTSEFDFIRCCRLNELDEAFSSYCSRWNEFEIPPNTSPSQPKWHKNPVGLSTAT